jgi:hypothetical protein
MKLHHKMLVLRFVLSLQVLVVALSLRASEPVTLLFAGSSSTYWNDMPREVAKLVSGKIVSSPGSAVTPAIVGRSGSDIRVYLEPDFARYEYGVKPGQSFLEKIASERPRYVVLQVVARFIMGDDDQAKTGNAHTAAITKYCEAIRKAGGEPVFYEMGWGNSESEREGLARIMKLAQENRIEFFAPCASAWARVYAERPDLALQHPQDSSHPGDAGHFLNLACFYAALTRQSPDGKLPRTYSVWPHAVGKSETDEAHAADEARLAKFQPDEYQTKMPKWMHRLMAYQGQATLPEETARYLETVAWETWQAKNKVLCTPLNKK